MSHRDPGQRHLMGEVPLRDYFKSDQEADEVFAAIRLKVVGTMLSAENPLGRRTGADNYIGGLDSRIDSLTAWVMQNIRGLHKVFGHNDMPKHSAKLTRQEWERVIDRIHWEIVSAILVTMRNDGNLWYMEGDGDWMFSNVIRIGYDRANREARQAFYDNRSWHGRPPTQGRRRAKRVGTAPGVSVGVSASF